MLAIKDIGDTQGEGVTLNNISQIYKARGDYDNALKYLLLSLNIMKDIGDKKGEGVTLANLAMLFLELDKQEEAFKCIREVININLKLNDYQLTSWLKSVGLQQ